MTEIDLLPTYGCDFGGSGKYTGSDWLWFRAKYSGAPVVTFLSHI